MSIAIHVADTAQQLGKDAARTIAGLLCDAIAQRGEARLILSTGASQFETMQALIEEAVDWS